MIIGTLKAGILRMARRNPEIFCTMHDSSVERLVKDRFDENFPGHGDKVLERALRTFRPPSENFSTNTRKKSFPVAYSPTILGVGISRQPTVGLLEVPHHLGPHAAPSIS